MLDAIPAFTVLDVAMSTPDSPDLPPGARLADVVLDGGLKAFLTHKRAQDRSWFAIARELYFVTEGKVDVTGPTVADWAQRLGVETEAAS